MSLGIRPEELIVDNFAGGGGASKGIEAATGRHIDIAINHDPEAIAIHKANHPHTLHLCQDVFSVDPVEVCGGRPVGIAWFSPDCTHFSRAKGGKPVERKRRALADVVIDWGRAVEPARIFLENVREWIEWGPLDDDGRPIASEKGLEFRRWRRELEACGYVVEVRELMACNYGAPTSRNRLFVVARRDGRKPMWPVATHGKGLTPYRTAAECIDWTIPCPSIFSRTRPLAENTLKRIARGLQRYVLNNPEPFVVKNMTNNVARGVDEPLSTILTGGHHLLVTPTLAGIDHASNEAAAWQANAPLNTITSKARHAVVAPIIAGVGGRQGQSPERPLTRPYQTITTKGDSALVTPLLVQTGYGEREGQAARCLDIERPLGTVVAGGIKHALAQAQLQLWDESRPWHRDEVRAFMIKYYGTDGDQQLQLPLHTITTKDRFGLVTVAGAEYEIVDIGLRMLTPRELFRAQGFPDEYVIEVEVNGRWLPRAVQVRAVGNSVSPPAAEALVRANLPGSPVDGAEVAA